jgi:DNA-binding beta-propeller fold protein YncE
MKTAITLAALAAACGSQGLEAGSPDDDLPGGGTLECFSASECPVGFACSELGVCVAPPEGGESPPEAEYRLSEPSSSRRFVWVAMPDQDRLARIDGETLAIESVRVGDRPRVLATLPETDTAVVLDAANAAATVVDDAAPRLVPTLPNLNRLAVAPGGRYAVAFFDLAHAIRDAGGLDRVGPIGSFQDVTLLAVGPGTQRAVDLTVGFRPRAVEHDAGGRFAFVVTDDGISVLDLPLLAAGGATIVPPIPLAPGNPEGLEVHVAGSGRFAIVRAPGAAGLRIVTLLGETAGAAFDVPLPGVPTDLDLAPDGTRVYAALRDPARLAVIRLPSGEAGPIDLDPPRVTTVELPGATGGSLALSADGRRGLLFTNATLDERITVVELDDPTLAPRTFPLQKAVLAAGFDPTGTKAVVLHARAPGDPDAATTVEEYIDRSPGYALLDVATGFAKLQLTAVTPTRFVFAPGAPRAYVTLDGGDADGALVAVQHLELDSGVVRTIPLGSPPEALGVLPVSNQVFISQRHPLGRVSFIDILTGRVRTVTGFDLNGQVID